MEDNSKSNQGLGLSTSEGNDPDLDPMSPAAFEYRDAPPGEIERRDNEDLQKFNDALGSDHVIQEFAPAGVHGVPQHPRGNELQVAEGPSRIRRTLSVAFVGVFFLGTLPGFHSGFFSDFRNYRGGKNRGSVFLHAPALPPLPGAEIRSGGAWRHA